MNKNTEDLAKQAKNEYHNIWQKKKSRKSKTSAKTLLGKESQRTTKQRKDWKLMILEFKLSPLQKKQIVSCIDLKDIEEFIENHKEEYLQFLKEEQEKERTR